MYAIDTSDKSRLDFGSQVVDLGVVVGVVEAEVVEEAAEEDLAVVAGE